MNTDKKEYGISVIMPCYNTEQYVEETLKSVLNQSFKDYEIICLNDGSTDGTLEILKRYQQSYPNIRVISSENHGIAYQRNTGVQCAQGKYIYYMDSDDLLKENCLETLYQYAEADNLDVVYFEADSFYETKEIEEAFPQFLTLYHRHKEYDGIYDGRNLYIQMENAGDIKMSVGLQFTRHQFLLDNNIKFGMERYFEDNLYPAIKPAIIESPAPTVFILSFTTHAFLLNTSPFSLKNIAPSLPIDTNTFFAPFICSSFAS